MLARLCGFSSGRDMMKILPKILTKTDRLMLYIGSSGTPPDLGGKLIAWLPGHNRTQSTKQESLHGYDFDFDSCLPEYWFDDDGNLMLDANGDPMYSSFVLSGWECLYYAPAVGDDGHDELIAVDLDHLLYDVTGVPIGNTAADLYAIDNDQMFFCEQAGRGLVIYDSVLTGSDLLDAQEWENDCIVQQVDDNEWVFHENGTTPIFDEDGSELIYMES